MTQAELRANIEGCNLKVITTKRLLVAKDIARDKLGKLQRIHNALRGYNAVGGTYFTSDLKDSIDECLHAVAYEKDIYGAFVSRIGEEIRKRVRV